ncbi:MAG: recombinase family protein, partial [Bacillota bacterium]|nr:recombinase family protein [Bacillota bacterium]
MKKRQWSADAMAGGRRKRAAYTNTAIYIRLSREDGDKEESNSVSVQKRMLQDYVAGEEGLELYETYVDDGYTGTNFERPAFRR